MRRGSGKLIKDFLSAALSNNVFKNIDTYDFKCIYELVTSFLAFPLFASHLGNEVETSA